MEQGEFIKELPAAAVIQLKDSIKAKGQKVSKLALVQRPNLAMSLLSVDTGSSIGGHSSPGDALVNILSGQAEVAIGDSTYTVRAGESIVMPANITHALSATEAFQMLLIVVKPD